MWTKNYRTDKINCITQAMHTTEIKLIIAAWKVTYSWWKYRLHCHALPSWPDTFHSLTRPTLNHWQHQLIYPLTGITDASSEEKTTRFRHPTPVYGEQKLPYDVLWIDCNLVVKFCPQIVLRLSWDRLWIRPPFFLQPAKRPFLWGLQQWHTEGQTTLHL